MQPRRQLAVPLAPNTAVLEGFLHIARQTLSQLTVNQHGFLLKAEAEPDFLQQMRTAVRQLRAAFGAYQAYVPGPATAYWLRDELRWLGQALAKAEAWDSLLHSTMPMVMVAHPTHDEWTALLNELSTHQTAEHKAVREILHSERYQLFLLRLGHWLALAEDAIKHEERLATLSQRASKMLRQRYKRLQETLQATAFNNTEPANASTTRKLAYLTEMFTPFLMGQPSDGFVSKLAHLQALLAHMHNTEQTFELLAQLQSCPEARGLIKGWLAREMDFVVGQLPAACRHFLKLKRTW